MTRMQASIIITLFCHPGMCRREIASDIHVWQCDFYFLQAMNELEKDGIIKSEYYSDPANMESYFKWYLVQS